jgi:hypothetical protein
MKRFGCALAALASLAVVAQPALAGDTSTRTQRISATGDLLGSHQQLRGTVAVDVPTAWASGNRTRVPRTAVLHAKPAAGCQVAIAISPRGAATRATTAAQVTHSIGSDALGRGTRAHGSWGMSATDTTLYAIGAVHLTQHKYVHIRAFATLGEGCDPGVLTEGAIPAAFERIVKRGVVDAVVQRR